MQPCRAAAEDVRKSNSPYDESIYCFYYFITFGSSIGDSFDVSQLPAALASLASQGGRNIIKIEAELFEQSVQMMRWDSRIH